MFDRFTDRARKVMGLARQEAQRLRHDYIGTEHVLLGLVEEGSGVAASVLKNLDVDLRKIRRAVEKLVGGGSTIPSMGLIPFTPRAKKVLELSLEEATRLGHTYIGTEHLLLGLIREDESIAAQVLRNMNVRIEDVRTGVLEILGEDPTDGAPGTAVHTSGSHDEDTPHAGLVTLLRLLASGHEEIEAVLREAGVDRDALIRALRRRIDEA